MFFETPQGSSILLVIVFFLFFVALVAVALIFFTPLGDKRNKESGAVSASTLPAGSDNGIQFDDGLITKLKGDHQELIGIFTAINQSADDGHFIDILPVLSAQAVTVR